MNRLLQEFIDSSDDNTRERLADLGGLDALGVSNTASILPGLSKFTIKQDDSEEAKNLNIKESMKFTLWQIYNEAIIAYAMKLERITALACRAVAERALRICLQDVTGKVAYERLPLGPLIKRCKESGLASEVLNLAETIKNEGDNLAHAKFELLKHWNGLEMRIDPTNSKGPPVAHYQTGNAKVCLIDTRDLLKVVFGSQ